MSSSKKPPVDTPSKDLESEDKPSPQGEKLQKVLARAGIGSRREMERVIEKGRVNVNGHKASLGDRILLTDRVEVDGKRIHFEAPEQQSVKVLLYNKPEGEICSRSDPEGRPTVFDQLPKLKGERWISVGRLDFNTSGLLLFTTDGELANRLMHPSSKIDREYLVRIQGDVDDDMKDRLRQGVMLEDGMARFTDIVDGAGQGRNHWFYCVVMEGRNREVRRLWESQDVKVSRLKRVRFGNIFIPSHVRVGQWTELNDKEIRDLCLTAGVDSPKQNAPFTPAQQAARERHQRKLRAGKSRRKR
ncbi:MAG: 23S rRNA pseudouridine(2605) synthase RluB [Cellvibrionaceae bacterium]